MATHDDSPPDGDYAAYIDKLMRQSQAANTTQATFGSDMGEKVVLSAPVPAPATPDSRTQERSKAAPFSLPGNISLNPAEPREAPPRVKKRSFLPLIIVVLFLGMPMLHVARDMLQNPRPEGFFILAVLIFMVFSIGHSIRSGRNPQNRHKKSAIPPKDDYPDTGN